MKKLLTERELHKIFDQIMDEDISNHITYHEYKIVGILSALISLDDSIKTLPSFKELKKAYRIGGMHINVIDRADDVLDGERGFEQTENPKEFLESWLKVLEREEYPNEVKESEHVAFEACIHFREILSEESKDKYYRKMKEVVDLEKEISGGKLDPEQEYRTHLESAGACLEALAIPLREHTSYQGSQSELRQIGKFFQIVDDIQDLEEDNYFPGMSREDARTEMRDIQKEISENLGDGFSRKIIILFGRYVPVIDDYIDFKKYV